MKYTNTRKSLGGVDHEKGIAWRVVGGVDHADGDSFPHIWGGIDYGVPLPLANSSAWVYAQAGIAGGQSESPLGAYYFGSFRNNYVDNRPEKRYRELESFPGFEIDQIAARKFAKLTGEVNLPPLRFAEVGTPAFFLSYARPALFGGTMLFGSPGWPELPALRCRRAGRPGVHRRDAAADGLFGRRGARVRRQGHRRTRPNGWPP